MSRLLPRAVLIACLLLLLLACNGDTTPTPDIPTATPTVIPMVTLTPDRLDILDARLDEIQRSIDAILQMCGEAG